MNVGPFERWLSAVAGGALAAYGLRRRAVPGGTAALAGAALLYRKATGHCRVCEALGRRRAGGRGTGAVADRHSNTRYKLGGSRGVPVEESVTVNRPVAEVYRFWRNLENFPRFMQHLEEVAVREEGVSHWVAKGPCA